MKFKDMPYERVDFAQAEKELRQLMEEFDQAKSGEEQFKVHEKFYELDDRVSTQMTIAHIRYDVDTTDEFYSKEHDYYNENRPVYVNLALEYQKKLYASPYRDYLEKKIGPVAFKNMELAEKSMDEKLIPLMQEENALTTEYNKLIAGAKIEFDGQVLNLSLLRPYMVHSDRNVRAQAHKKRGEFFLANAEKLDEIYDKLVKNRTAQARAMGYENYLELGYYRMRRNCYGRRWKTSADRSRRTWFPMRKSSMSADARDWGLRSSVILTIPCILRKEILLLSALRRKFWRQDRKCTPNCLPRQKNSMIS